MVFHILRLSHFVFLLLVTGVGLFGVSPRPFCHLCGGSGHGVLPVWACPQFLWEMSIAGEFLSQRGFTCSQMLANAIVRGGPVCPLSASVWGFPLLSIFASVWYYLCLWQSDEYKVVSYFCFLNTSEVDRFFLLVEIPFL